MGNHNQNVHKESTLNQSFVELDASLCQLQGEQITKSVKENDLETLNSLVQLNYTDKVNIAGESAAFVALKYGHTDCFLLLHISNAKIYPAIPYNGTPMHLAALYSDKNMIQHFLKNTKFYPTN